MERKEREKEDKSGVDDEKLAEGVKAESGDEESSDEDEDDDEASDSSDSPMDDSALAQKSAMTARSRGRKWKRESLKVQQRRVREEFKRRKVADQRLSRSSTMLSALQQRYGSYYALSIPSKVDRQPMWWWQAEDDKRLLVGVSKHGMDFRAIEEDEQLGFAQRLNEEPVKQVKEEGNEQAAADTCTLIDPFVTPSATDEGASAVSPSLAAVNANGDSQLVSCICSRDPKSVKAATSSSPTKLCARCHHSFHTDCLDKARDDNTLRPEQFPPMPTQQNGRHDADDDDDEEDDNGAMDDSQEVQDDDQEEDEEEEDEQRRPAHKAKAKASKSRTSKKRGQDEDGEEDDDTALDDTVEDEQDEDDEDESTSRSRAKSASPNSWMCDRCDMVFPADRALEFRLRSLIEAFDRDRHAIARFTKRRMADKSARPAVPRKAADESNTAWTRKDRLRVQRGVQLFGCTDAGIALMRRKMDLTGKSESSLRAYCERLVAQCQLIVAQSRREQDEQSFHTTAAELQTRGEELGMLTERVDRIAAKESELQRKREDRKARQEKVGDSSASSSEAEDTSMFCSCEGKVDDDFMVSCDAQEPGCKEWYHCKCVGLQHDEELPAVWLCPNCKTKQAARAPQREDDQKLLTAPVHLKLNLPSPKSANVIDRQFLSTTSLATHSSHPSTATTPTAVVSSAFSTAATGTTPAVVPLAAAAQPVYNQNGLSFQQPTAFSFHMQPQQQQQQLPQHFASFHPQYGQHQQQLEQAFFQHRQQQQQSQQMAPYPHAGFMQQGAGQYMNGYGTAAMGVPFGHPQQFSVLQPMHFSPQYGQPQYDGSYAYAMHPQSQQDERMLLFSLQQQQQQQLAIQQHMQQQYEQQQQVSQHPQQAMYGTMSQQPHMQQALSVQLASSIAPAAPVVPLGAQSASVWPLQPPSAVPVQPIAPPNAVPPSPQPQPATVVPVAPLSHFSSLALPATSSRSSSSTPASSTPTSTSPAPASKARSPTKASPLSLGKSAKRDRDSPTDTKKRRSERDDGNKPAASRSNSLSQTAPKKVKQETLTPKHDNGSVLSAQKEPAVRADSKSPVVKVKTEAADAADELAAVPISQPGVPREASWRVRRRLYSTAAAVMQRQIEKLKVELDNEMSKLHDWHKQRMQIDNTFAASAAASLHACSQLSGFLPAADTELTPLLAQKILSRVMLLATVREVCQQPDEIVASKLSTVPTDSMPQWFQPPVHDLAVMRCVLTHGLGMIDEMLADPLFAPALASPSSGARQETRDFFVSFLRDKGPLLRRLLLACNWVQSGSRDSADDWLDWLLTSKRDWKGGGYRVNSSLSGYNVTSSATLKALTDDRAEGGKDGQSGEVALLSIQSISNWARVREAALRMNTTDGSDDEKGEEQTDRRTARRSNDYGDEEEDEGSEESERAERRRKRRSDAQSRSGRSRDDDRPDKKRHSGRRHQKVRSRLRSRSDSRSPIGHTAETIARERDGRPKLPLSLPGGVTLLSLGRIVTDRPLYAPGGSSIIFPVGFKSRRFYYSLTNAQTRTAYTSTIEEDGPQPLFIITPTDEPAQRIVAHSASAAWSTLIKRVHKLRGKGEGRSNKSGLLAFGLVHPTIKQLIGEMDGADAVRRRWRRGADAGKQAGDRERDKERERERPRDEPRTERVKEGGRRKQRKVEAEPVSDSDEDEEADGRDSDGDAFASAESDNSSASQTDDGSESSDSDGSAAERRKESSSRSERRNRRRRSGGSGERRRQR